MGEEIRFEGVYGVVKVKDGKAVKKAKPLGSWSLNREAIAYMRMKKRDSNIAICKVFKCTINEGHQPPTSSFVHDLTMEDAGTSLNTWMSSQWFFDPIFVLLHPLLDALEFLKKRGVVQADLHTGNICIARNKRGKLEAKLLDFGCSVVVRVEEEWPCHTTKDLTGSTRLFVDPRTQLPSDQSTPPSKDVEEVELKTLYNAHLHRDPLSLVALAASHEGCIPRGLMLGNADDVYGLGMCIVRMLTMFTDVPWGEWQALNCCSSVYAKNIRLKTKVLGEILQHNPAWDSRHFRDLHTRFRPVSDKLEDAKTMEASARAIEVYLSGIFTLYPNFFVHLDVLYDAQTSDLVRSCVHPDRHRRYNHTPSEQISQRRKATRPRRYTEMRRGDLKVKMDYENRIHVQIGHCWIMTGIAIGGRMRWWNAVKPMTTCVERMHQSKNVMRSALDIFISKVRKLDSLLKDLPCTEWPFDHEIQREEWLKLLELYWLRKPTVRLDKGPNLVPRSSDKSVPTEYRHRLLKVR